MLGKEARTYVAVVFAFGLAISLPISWAISQLHPTIGAPPSQSEKQATEQTAEEKADDRIARYTLWLAALTGTLTVATIGLMGATIFQLRLARQEFIASHRPRMRVREFRMLGAGDGNQIRWTLTNVGGSKAIIRGVRAKAILRTADAELDAPDYSGCNEVITMTAFRPGNLDEQATLRLGPKWSNDSASWLYVFGYVAYGDELGNGFLTAFIRRWDWPRGRFVPVDDPDYEHED